LEDDIHPEIDNDNNSTPSEEYCPRKFSESNISISSFADSIAVSPKHHLQ